MGLSGREYLETAKVSKGKKAKSQRKFGRSYRPIQDWASMDLSFRPMKPSPMKVTRYRARHNIAAGRRAVVAA
jgi:hypothetical protein